jgi:nucleotide-binding universal stress UspA family protein
MNDRFPGHMLCPVDFSEMSAAAYRFAARLAGACDARLTAIHVYNFEAPAYFTPAQAGEIAAQFEATRADAEAALRRFASESGGPGEPAVLVREGDPANAVLRAAAELQAGLIVMSTHGRSGLRRLLLGSVAERVLRDSSIPVLTIRGPDVPVRIGSIVCPVNDSETSRQAFRAAARIASCCGADVLVVHIDEGPHDRRIDDLCAWRSALDAPQCTIRELRRSGNPAEEILKIAAEMNAGLLVIGAEHKTFFDSTVLGTTTVRVVRHAQCPVLTVIEGAPTHDAVSDAYQTIAR